MKKIFSIRKLAIGVASVSLGMTGVSSINSTNTSSASYYSDYNYSPYNYSSFTSSDYIELEPKSYYELKVGKEVTVVRSKSPINSYYATGNRIVDIESATVSKTGSITNEFGRTINMNFDGYELRVTPLRAGTSIIHFEQNGVEKTIEVKVVNDVSEKQEKTTQEIPFETIYNDDNNLNTGEEIVDREGIPGLKEINSTYTVINGIRQSNPKVEEIILKEKVDKIVRRGTKVTTYESEKNVQNIPFETIYKDDNSLDKGKEVVITEGINGTKEITTTFTVINGIRQDNPKIEEKVTKDKVDKVVRRGTKVSTTATPELPNNTNKPISPISNDSKPNTVAPTDKPANSSTNDSKPNTVTPADKPAVDNSIPTLANVTLENINNDISVTLATAETGVKLVTDEVTNPTTLNEVKEKITNENNSITSTTDITNLRVVDLTLEKEGKKYSTNANRTVRIALLNNEKGNEILVYHVKDNGELEELTKEKNNLTITNDSVEFTINHFSKFAVASIKKNIPTPSTNTSDEHNKNKDTRRDLTDIKPSESNQNKILPRTGISSSSTVLLGATLLSLALISRKLKKN